MECGAARVDITPALPADLQGFARRDAAARQVDRPLLATVCVLRSPTTTIVVVAADVLAFSGAYVTRLRSAIAAELNCDPSDVLLNASHTHAAMWPGRPWKVSGEKINESWESENSYDNDLLEKIVTTAEHAAARTVPARVSHAVGRVAGMAVNRRERLADGRTVIGWNQGGFVDEELPVLRIDGLNGRAIATIVGFGCH